MLVRIHNAAVRTITAAAQSDDIWNISNAVELAAGAGEMAARLTYHVASCAEPGIMHKMPDIKQSDNVLTVTAEVAVGALKKLKSPGVKFLTLCK